MIKISIIIPCFNEFNTITKIIDKILEIKKFDFEIIVIDDLSNDGSREILKNLLEEKIQHLIFQTMLYLGLIYHIQPCQLVKCFP